MVKFQRALMVNFIRATTIGLSVVQTVMRRHGGVLAVQSQLNKGSAFTLRFPKSPVVTQN